MKNKKPKTVKWPAIVKTRRLLLRPFTRSDYANYVQAFSNAKPAQNEFDRPPLKKLSRKDYNKRCARWEQRAAKDLNYVLGVFDKKTLAILGFVDLFIFDRYHAQSANFGYCLINNYWGQGYGQEAARALAIFAFKNLKLHRLEASIAPNNKASLHLIRAIGFKKEGLRKQCDWRNGSWQDDWVYYATPQDFGLPMRPPQILR